MKLFLAFCILLLSGCAGTQKVQKPTWYMNSDSKIQYYQEQINHYQFLIDQERKKIELDK
jgi:outer membrane biogenesis lipoprotein LolB